MGPVESVEHLVVGAGPAGLRAAQVLAEAGREVLVAERNAEVGPKTCAGGLTVKCVRELAALGLPDDVGLTSVGHAAFSRGDAIALDPDLCAVRTVARRTLGRYQLEWTRRAGAEVRTGTAVHHLDLAARTAQVGDRTIRWTHLVGADGSESRVRHALGLPAPRAYFACEYNVPGVRLGPLRVECDPVAFANGYFWVFPHEDYTSIGCGAPKHQVRPADLHRELDRRMDALGLASDAAPFEGATIEVDFRGTDFPGNVHLVGDAAGLPSSLTAEGIYAALVSGEAVARRILEPGHPAPALRRWLRVKRRHDALATLLGAKAVRVALLPVFQALAALPPLRRAMARFYLGG